MQVDHDKWHYGEIGVGGNTTTAFQAANQQQ